MILNFASCIVLALNRNLTPGTTMGCTGNPVTGVCKIFDFMVIGFWIVKFWILFLRVLDYQVIR